MSGGHGVMGDNRTGENVRKRHYSSDTDSNDTSAKAWHDGTPPFDSALHDVTPPFDSVLHDGTPPFDTAVLHDNVAPSNESVVTKHTKAALVKKLKDSTKQHQTNQSLLPHATPTAAGQPKVSKQEHLASPLVARWHHKSMLQPAQSQSSLLEDVLNEKKLALLQSPEVRAFLEHAQCSVAEEKRRDNAPEGATHTADDSEPWRREAYVCDPETRGVWTSARTANVAGADIWSKEASAFTSVVRPTQQ